MGIGKYQMTEVEFRYSYRSRLKVMKRRISNLVENWDEYKKDTGVIEHLVKSILEEPIVSFCNEEEMND